MDRREFLKVTGAGMLTLFLSGCGTLMAPKQGKATSLDRYREVKK